MVKSGARDERELEFPTFEYNLDRSGAQVVIVRRRDGSFMAQLSAQEVLQRRASSKPPRSIFESLSGLTLTRLVPKLLSLRL
jgi:hypothetical protein